VASKSVEVPVQSSFSQEVVEVFLFLEAAENNCRSDLDQQLAESGDGHVQLKREPPNATH
jgi:hypothetical protein